VLSAIGRVAPALAMASLALASFVTHVRADRGVSIDAGQIDVTQKLSRGGQYRLPQVGVRNPGTETTLYRMSVAYRDGQQGRRPPESWFSFSPAELTLDPGESTPVEVRLDIPTGARPDDYEAVIQAEIAPGGEGTTVGAAAAARVRFTVKPSTLLQAWQLEAQDRADSLMPWTVIVPSSGALILAGWWLRQRFTVTVRRRT
jgi:hypothetical protein